MNEVTTQNVAIIGSGPAGWTAAIYAARAALEPILFEGALTPENQDAGRLPMGQLATTTYVENYPGFPAGDLREYLKTTIAEERQYALPYDTFDDDASKRGVSGPALVELMRKQALDCGVRVVSEDVAKVDFSKRPFKLIDSNGDEYFARSVIVATGASARWLGLTSEELFKNNGVSACAVCDGALPRFYKRPILVVGGGDSAAEDALYLTKFASKVYL
ncbi:MAG: FAD-dependent oxidoreductase, partial [Thermoguttaceae bacterium]|nr:FAD-dependent oxidoreductase [Thermoguttaceae bacterium]